MAKPKITTRLHIHLNGGSEYSMRVDNILIDGEEVPGMALGTCTDGSPEFKLTSRELCFHPPGTHGPEDEERLDLMEESLTQEQIDEWILARAPGVREASGG